MFYSEFILTRLDAEALMNEYDRMLQIVPLGIVSSEIHAEEIAYRNNIRRIIIDRLNNEHLPMD